MFWVLKRTISLYPPQTFFVEGILFSCQSVGSCVCPSVTFCFLNILKSHCWNFIKLCKHIYIYKTNTLSKKVRARGQFKVELFSFVVLNGFLYRGLCLCYYRPYTCQSTPTTAFYGAIRYFAYTMKTHWTYAWRNLVEKNYFWQKDSYENLENFSLIGLLYMQR